MVHTWKELIEIAENLGWRVTYDMPDNGALYEMDFAQYSPAGEDFSFYCSADTPEDMVSAIYDEYSNFNIDEHAVMCHGMRGAPNLHVLIHDAESIREMLFELHRELTEVG